jgi:hypothetical protein
MRHPTAEIDRAAGGINVPFPTDDRNALKQKPGGGLPTGRPTARGDPAGIRFCDFPMKQLRRNRLALLAGCFLAGAWFAGCTAGETNRAASLQQAMEASHKAAIGVLNRANAEMLPYRIELGVLGGSFSKDDLALLGPSDIAAWDRILGGLDTYCAAMTELTSGKEAADFTASAESFGLKVQSLVKTVKGSSGSGIIDAATAVTALGRALVNEKAGHDARAIAKAADPGFHAVVGDLIGALGFAGVPAEPTAHGLLATYEAAYRTSNAENSLRRFKGDAIAGFDAMTPAERKAAITDFVAWLRVERDHEDFVESVTALAGALNKAAVAHAALARGDPATVGAAFADLRAEIQNTVQIYQKYKQG